MSRTTPANGFFRNALDSMMAARARQANRYVANTLLMFDDETLKQHGYSRETLRKNANASTPYIV